MQRRTCPEYIIRDQAREVNRLQDTAVSRVFSPVFLVKENPLFDRFYHRSLQGFPICRVFDVCGLRLSKRSGPTDLEICRECTNGRLITEWCGNAIALVYGAPERRESLCHMFEITSGMAINYRGNPRPCSLGRCVIHQRGYESSDAFGPYLVISVNLG